MTMMTPYGVIRWERAKKHEANQQRNQEQWYVSPGLQITGQY